MSFWLRARHSGIAALIYSHQACYSCCISGGSCLLGGSSRCSFSVCELLYHQTPIRAWISLHQCVTLFALERTIRQQYTVEVLRPFHVAIFSCRCIGSLTTNQPHSNMHQRGSSRSQDTGQTHFQADLSPSGQKLDQTRSRARKASPVLFSQGQTIGAQVKRPVLRYGTNSLCAFSLV